MDEVQGEAEPSGARPREASVLRRLCRVVAGFRRVLRQELLGHRALAGQIATETRLLAELLALPAGELWRRFGTEAEVWEETEPLLTLDLLEVVKKRAQLGEPEATELAWLVVLLALRLRSGQLREDLQRDLIARALLELTELRWEAGDDAGGERLLRLAGVLAASGSRSLSLRGRLASVGGRMLWMSGEIEKAVERLGAAADSFRADGNALEQAECHLWLELLWAQGNGADEAEAARRAAKKLLGREVDRVAGQLVLRLSRARASRGQREDCLDEST
jgi:hypothetical protein